MKIFDVKRSLITAIMTILSKPNKKVLADISDILRNLKVTASAY